MAPPHPPQQSTQAFRETDWPLALRAEKGEAEGPQNLSRFGGGGD